MSARGSVVPGQAVGPYEVLAPLGAGGFGEVFRVRHVRVGGEYALKVCTERLTSQGSVAAFQREALIANAVARASRHVARVHEAGVIPETGRAWFVMDLIEGVSLAERLRRGPLALPEALRVLSDVAHALEAAHAAGVIHCDLKPENVLLHETATSDGRVMATLVDFGIARALGAATGTLHTTAAGSPAWMAPEQLEGGTVGSAADVWAFGRLAYLLVAGEPYASANPDRDSPAKIARSKGRAVPEAFDAWCARASHPSSRERTQRVGAAMSDLRALFGGERGVTTAGITERMGRTVAGVGLAVLAGLGALVGLREAQSRRAETNAPTEVPTTAAASGASPQGPPCELRYDWASEFHLRPSPEPAEDGPGVRGPVVLVASEVHARSRVQGSAPRQWLTSVRVVGPPGHPQLGRSGYMFADRRMTGACVNATIRALLDQQNPL